MPRWADIVVKVLKCVGLFFPPNDKTSRKSPIDMASNPSQKSPVSSSPNEVTPHIFIRTSQLQPANFAIVMQKDFCNNIGHFRTHAPQKIERAWAGANLLLGDVTQAVSGWHPPGFVRLCGAFDAHVEFTAERPEVDRLGQ